VCVHVYIIVYMHRNFEFVCEWCNYLINPMFLFDVKVCVG
jgi:hypothetical protein